MSGTKQVLKAAKSGEVKKVYIGKDAEKHIVADLIKFCKETKIDIVYMETMKELGKYAGIDVGTATAAE